MKVLVVNHAHSEICGIYDIGLRFTQRLNEAGIDAQHIAANDQITFINCATVFQPDVTIFNYREDLMPWVIGLPARFGRHLAVIHNYTVDTFALRSGMLRHVFDGVVAFDTEVTSDDPMVFSVPRPLPHAVEVPELDDTIRIGSFGFAFYHKRFDLVAAEADTLDRGVFELLMPEAFFNGALGNSLFTDNILDSCRASMHPGVEFHHVRDYIPSREVVWRLAHNHVNCLLYAPGQPDAGLSSALDFLIAARRPILVSTATMFTHGQKAVAYYPQYRVLDVLRHRAGWECRVADLYRTTVDASVLAYRQMIERCVA